MPKVGIKLLLPESLAWCFPVPGSYSLFFAFKAILAKVLALSCRLGHGPYDHAFSALTSGCAPYDRAFGTLIVRSLSITKKFD